MKPEQTPSFIPVYTMAPVDIGSALAETHRHLEALLKIEHGLHDVIRDQHGNPCTVVFPDGIGNVVKAIDNALERSQMFQKELIRQATSVNSLDQYPEEQ